MIELRDLSVSYGAFRLQKVDLTVEAGQTLVLLGPSGAGKTLLLETILELKRPDTGEVRINGLDALALPPEARGVGYMPQDLALFPHLSVRENILFGRRARRTMERAEADLARLAAMLRIEGLLEREEVRTLSGGERQRVALARALMVRPDVLFLDESFSALDQDTRQGLLADFRRLQQALGVTVVLVTHSLEEAFEMADRIAILMEGQVVQVAEPKALLRRPAGRRVARFLRMRNVLPVEAVVDDGERLRVQVAGAVIDAGEAPLVESKTGVRSGEARYVALPAGALVPHRVGNGAAAGEAGLMGEVAGVAERGQEVWLQVQLGGDGAVVECLYPRWWEAPAVRGESVELRIAADAVAVFGE